MIGVLLETIGIDSWIVFIVCFFNLVASATGLLLYMVAPPSCEEPVLLYRVDFAAQFMFSLFIGFMVLATHPQIMVLPEHLRMTGTLGQIVQTYKDAIGGISLTLLIIDLIIPFGRANIVKSVVSKLLSLIGHAGFALYLCTAINQKNIPCMLLFMLFFHHVSVIGFGGQKRKK